MGIRSFVCDSFVWRKASVGLLGFLLALGVIVPAAALLIFMWVGPEGYFFAYPAIDTEFTPGYTESAFVSVQPGMTKAEVLVRLGPPFNPVTDQGWTYSRDGAAPIGDFAWLVRGVNFDITGRVIERASMIAYD